MGIVRGPGGLALTLQFKQLSQKNICVFQIIDLSHTSFHSRNGSLNTIINYANDPQRRVLYVEAISHSTHKICAPVSDLNIWLCLIIYLLVDLEVWAIRQLEGYKDYVETVELGTEDDVAQPNGDNDYEVDDFYCDVDQDELVEEAEDWVFHSDHSDSENDTPIHENDEPRSTLSRDGTLLLLVSAAPIQGSPQRMFSNIRTEDLAVLYTDALPDATYW